jgi:S-methylmethionine-dependent homocysteine/selenocysteine methylase
MNTDAINHPSEIFLTDGGLETTLIYHRNIDLPHFAAFELMLREEGKQVLMDYYAPYLDLASAYRTGFILETPTWRANPEWADKLGYDQKNLDEINLSSIELMKGIRANWQGDKRQLLISGNIGPRGDGYVVRNAMSADTARAYHLPQIACFASAGAQHVTAMTMSYSAEALGIVLAAREVGVPVVISFTVETNGELPSGERLQDAIESIDHLTDAYVSYYMINCAHPYHFNRVLNAPGSWKLRIRGIRANASDKSHAELDVSTTLDPGDKHLLAEEYGALNQVLPAMQVIGGCCGTDHTHLDAICKYLFTPTPDRVRWLSD